MEFKDSDIYYLHYLLCIAIQMQMVGVGECFFQNLSSFKPFPIVCTCVLSHNIGRCV